MKQDSECCYICNSKEKRLLLHNIRLRGEYRQLCTSCVLKHHAGSFCPHCFEIYEGFNPPPVVDRITCLKCDFPSHLACVSKDVVTHYVCPSCLNPSHLYFDVGGSGFNNNNNNNNNNNTSSSSSSNHNQDGKDGESSSSTSSIKKVIDINLSKILLAATQFASMSMKRGTAAERIEAEKRVKEAWLGRKRAREALQEVYSTALRLKGNNGKESKMIQRIPSPVAVEEPMKKPKGNSAVAAAVVDQKRYQNQANSMALIERNNAKMRPVGFHAPHVVQRSLTNGAPAPAPAPAPVGNNDKLKGSPSPTTVMGYQQFQNTATVNGKDKSFNISQLRINDTKVESENNELLLVPKTEAQINHPIKEDPDEVKEFGDSRMFPQLIQSNEGSADAFISRNNKGVLHTGSSKTMS